MKCPLTKSDCPIGLDECNTHACDLLNSFLFSESGIMLVILDNVGKVKYVNESVVKITGYKKGNLYKKDWIELLVPDEEKEIVKLAFERALSQTEKISFINNIVDKDNKKHLVAWSNYLLMNGKPNLVCIGLQITRSQFVIDQLETDNFNGNKEEAALISGLNRAVNRLTMIRQITSVCN